MHAQPQCKIKPLSSAQQEFERLEDASGVFKLIGPVLIRQDPIEVSLWCNTGTLTFEQELERHKALAAFFFG